MSEAPSRAARPVADAPVAALVAAAEDVAKGWLIAVIGASELDAVAGIPIASLAEVAPGLCEAMAQALADDDALAQLRPGGRHHALAARAGALAGARDLVAVAEAVETLRRVMWEEMVARLERPSAAQVQDLAQRLSEVASAVLAATLRTPGAGTEVAEPERSHPHLRVLDRRESAGATQAAARPPWIVALERRLERARSNGRSVAALLVDLDDREHLTSADADGELLTAIEAVERAVSGELRPADVLLRVTGGRYWIVAPNTSMTEGRELAEAIDGAVHAAASHRGAPLKVSVGVAASQGDETAQALVEAAEEDMFAVRSWGGAGPDGPEAG